MKTLLRTITFVSASLVFGPISASAGKPDPSELSVTCGGTTFAPGAPATCPLGETLWIHGTDFPHNVDVLVVNTANNSTWYFDDRQTAPQGNLAVPLSNGFADAGVYRVDISAKPRLHRYVEFTLQ
jgi:hypothetical protein